MGSYFSPEYWFPKTEPDTFETPVCWCCVSHSEEECKTRFQRLNLGLIAYYWSIKYDINHKFPIELVSLISKYCINLPEKPELRIKCVMNGETSVGKTSLIRGFVDKIPCNTYNGTTIGASYKTTQLMVEKTNVRLQIWDIAGRERFRSLPPIYYRGADIMILVYDITSSRSYDLLSSFIDDTMYNINYLAEMKSTSVVCKSNQKDTFQLTVVGNKCDLKNDENSNYYITNSNDVRNLLDKLGKKYNLKDNQLIFGGETSCISLYNVENVFNKSVKLYIQRLEVCNKCGMKCRNLRE